MSKIENKETELDIRKKYSFPSNLVNVEHNNYYIVINPNTANWIVLKNKKQLEIFNMLKNFTIIECIKHFGNKLNDTDLISVLTEIEAKNLMKNMWIIQSKMAYVYT